MVIAWNTGAAAARFRHNLKLKKKKRKKRKAASGKLQAASFKRSSIFPSGYVNWFKKKMDRDFKIG
jgi:hypothetical protein